jgi:hypothetical protein
VEYFTLRNTVILALVQVGTVVAGVLAAGAAHKWYTTAGVRPPRSTTLVAEQGHLALSLPVAWAAVALAVLRREDDYEAPRLVVFSSGVLVLLLLLLGVLHSSAGPLLRLLGGCSLSA